MRLAKAVSELKIAYDPYLFFWNEWIADENCNLSSQEIEVVAYYTVQDFKIGMIDELLNYNEFEQIRDVIKKLKLGYTIFKMSVVADFLCTIIRFAKEDIRGFDAFLLTPIKDLNLPGDVKQILLGFKVYTLHLLVIVYKSEEFNSGWVYKQIIEFKKTIRSYEAINL